MKGIIEINDEEIGVVVPTRERRDDLLRLHESMIQTSTKARMLVYVDEDDRTSYPDIESLPRTSVTYGQKIGPVAAANRLCHLYRGSVQAYGMVADDSRFMTPGWDDYLLSTLASFPARIGVVSAAHNGGDYVNYGWVSREWIETVGWYFYPKNFHHCCDTIVEILGDATRIEYSAPHQFQMHHDLKHTMNRDQFDGDLMGCLTWLVGERRDLVRRIRAAIEQGSHEPTPA